MNLLNIIHIVSAFMLAFTSLSTAQSQAHNRTFTLIAYNTTNPYIEGKPVVFSSAPGIADPVVNPPPGSSFAPLVAFIWKGQILRYCTSPTGVCIGMLTKAYGGALTGWYFEFSDDETPKQEGPSPPITGGFGLVNDLEYPSPTSKRPCKPCKPKKVKVLAHDSGIRIWNACGSDQQDNPATQGYIFNSIPVPDFAVNGPLCSHNYGIKFKISYTN